MDALGETIDSVPSGSSATTTTAPKPVKGAEKQQTSSAKQNSSAKAKNDEMSGQHTKRYSSKSEGTMPPPAKAMATKSPNPRGKSKLELTTIPYARGSRLISSRNSVQMSYQTLLRG